MKMTFEHPRRMSAVVSAGLILLVGIIAPGASHAASTDHFKQKGSQASADIFGFDECISSSLFVSASSVTQKSQPGAPEKLNSTLVGFSQFDSCTGAQTFGFAFVENSASFDNRLNSASATASVPTTTCTFDATTEVFECVEGPTLAVTIQWTKSGSSSRQTFTSSFHNGDQLFRSRSSGNFAEATITASVTLGGSPLFDDPSTTSTFASLSDNTSTSLSIIKN